MAHRPLKLIVHAEALRHNWRALRDAAGVETGAAIKADGYGLGARPVMETLFDEGARDFFVATWNEAEQLGALPEGARLGVFHGVGPDDGAAAASSPARPVLNSVMQVQRWRAIAPDRPCDVMVETGMNRLGVGMDELGELDGLRIDTLHSHMACADEPEHPLNAQQLSRFREAKAQVAARRYSLANSAAICLGEDYAFDLVRPGIALYGGIPVAAMAGMIEPVVEVQAQVLQLRLLKAGDAIGYNATFTADRDTPVAILNLGYADGFPRNMSGKGHARIAGRKLPLLGRVSMDLVAVDVTHANTDLREGDWMRVDYDVCSIAREAGISQYEALTGLGDRFERVWKD
ncbi:alanine racemase [Sphingomicrobium sediminis]|uniref:Alanine racemase n=1 Tax=Sphingomicrobium sediminis TaxID=2950949 RepID=A0A9X2EGX2_9SPHN|nr:alanine racemase [Sphingomicrobium sediminis]MCM8557211.1 alanine racemase [Sphingomicrobium sediminis]